MGTRSTIAFIDKRVTKDGKVYTDELVRIYQQYDGYPSGVGKQLATWLSGKTIVNVYGIIYSRCHLSFNNKLIITFIR